ncbi:MAG: GYDIA family GHMP kinase [Saprospiraceae bacterium]
MERTISTHGKLLLTGEYFVLNGALALAIPARYGQQFIIKESASTAPIRWESFDHQNQKWFEGYFNLNPLRVKESTDSAVAERLLQIFTALTQLNPESTFLKPGLSFQSYLEFPNNWGLGSSSTLIAALAQWAAVDPYDLLAQTFGGSGYDLACAISDQPLLYQIQKDTRQFVQVPFFPDFHDQLYFVFLNQKQNSREGIQRYRTLVNPSEADRRIVSQLTLDFLQAKDLKEFEAVMNEHENFVATKLQLPKVKAQKFPDYWGAVKSLGAWGGDFVLATSSKSRDATVSYFKEKGLETVIPFADMMIVR